MVFSLCRIQGDCLRRIICLDGTGMYEDMDEFQDLPAGSIYHWSPNQIICYMHEHMTACTACKS